MSKYSPPIDLNNENSPHARLIRLVGQEKSVLDFGCATGHLSKILKEEYNCEVTGLEINRDDAEKAREHCKEVIIGDLDILDWCEELSGYSFDVAIFADVLEHLKDPKAILENTKNLLTENGYILVSVPNVANISVRLELLLGGFEYEDLGILDSSHLKYFTAKTIIQLIEDAGFFIDSFDYVIKDLPEFIIKDTLQKIDLTPSNHTLDYFTQTDAVAFEYIIKALAKKPDGYTPYQFEDVVKPERMMENLIQNYFARIELADKQIADLDNIIRARTAEIQKNTETIQNQAHQIESKNLTIQNQIQQIESKNLTIQNQIQQIESKNLMIQGHIQRIESLDRTIQIQKQQIQAKETHIHYIDTELNLIKQSKVWRFAEFSRKLIYIKLLGNFPLLKIGK